MNSFKIGPIRPPSEANSLLLQVTQGCTWNKCKFCQLYRNTKFKAFSVDDIKNDIDTMARIVEDVKEYKNNDSWDIDGIDSKLAMLSGMEQQCYYMVATWVLGGAETVFLQDGNTMSLKGGRLPEVLRYLKETFPSIKRITSYGRAQSLATISADEYRELKEAGLDRIHSGFESGSDVVLKKINKGTTREDEIKAGKNIKAGGIELSIYFMPGIGGKENSLENALETAKVINEVKPDFVRVRTAAIKEGTELYEDMIEEKFSLCSEDDKVMEIKTLIEHVNVSGSRITSDHIVNLLNIEGDFVLDKEKMLNIIDGYLNLSKEERRKIQLKKRTNGMQSSQSVKNISDQKWDKLINNIICRYI